MGIKSFLQRIEMLHRYYLKRKLVRIKHFKTVKKERIHKIHWIDFNSTSNFQVTVYSYNYKTKAIKIVKCKHCKVERIPSLLLANIFMAFMQIGTSLFIKNKKNMKKGSLNFMIWYHLSKIKWASNWVISLYKWKIWTKCPVQILNLIQICR